MALWILDASHGGWDFGTIGKEGRTESSIVLNAVLEAKKHLERNGEKVILTRSDDEYILINERIDIANTNDANYFISFHMNFSEDFNVDGVSVETINIDNENDRLGKLIKDELLSILNSEDKGVTINTDKEYDNLKIKGIKVFPAYLSNHSVEKEFCAKKYGEVVAKACLAVVNKVLLTTPITEPKLMQKKAWRVCLGQYKTYDEAEAVILKLKEQGNKSAFIAPVDK